MNNPYMQYYMAQSGTGLSHFSGTRRQHGRGIGSFFANLFRSAILPALKSSGKYLGKEALRTGVDVAKDVLEGTNIKEAAKTRAKEAGGRVIEKLASKVQGGRGRKLKRLNQYKGLISVNKTKRRTKRKSSSRISKAKLTLHQQLANQLR